MLCRHTELQQYEADLGVDTEFSYQAAAPGKATIGKMFFSPDGEGRGSQPLHSHQVLFNVRFGTML